ncbi:MAG: alkaline phosphatase family protein [Chitinophagaceae bacterium]|nr:alkaline phosphatase family protein [Chitinophagaceae bacterium]
MPALKIFTCIILSSFSLAGLSQNKSGLISGPWAGNVELRNATIWAEVTPEVKSVSVKYYPVDKSAPIKTVDYKGELGKDFDPVKIELDGLDMNTVYQYSLLINGRQITFSYPLQFTTKDLWQFRKPAPDFTFLSGSCSYMNQPLYDRPGKPYGGDSSIFETMANTKAAFHLWLGDNWYTREVDLDYSWGLNYRASHDRRLPILQKFMASMPQYAIWDDHDYGPNDAGKSYILKDESRKIFKNYWCNPSYGEEDKGIYTKVSYGDVDIFLTDDRYFRSEDRIADSINGQPNTSKFYFGKMQMEWLKNALLFSTATFKIIATGSQVLNPFSEFECMRHYTAEYNELMNFLAAEKVGGVIFFTGDRHHSEVLEQKRSSLYSLYDVTISPYTSGIGKVKGPELNNPVRVPGTLVEAQNFGKITVTGKRNERFLKVEFIGLKGVKLGEWSVSEKDLKKGASKNEE